MTRKLALISTLFAGCLFYCVSTASAFQPSALIAPELAMLFPKSADHDAPDRDSLIDDLSNRQLIPGYHDLPRHERFDVAPLSRPGRRSEFQVPHYYLPDVRALRKVA